MGVSIDQFVGVYREFREKLPEIDSMNLFDRSWINFEIGNRISWMPYSLTLAEASIQLPNAVNQLQIYAVKLVTWDQVLSRFADEDRMEYTLEFVEPIFLTAVSLPYALKQRFTFVTTLLCHHASLAALGPKHVDDLPNDRRIDVRTMDKFGAKWERFQNLKASIGQLFSEEHESSTEEFRNKFQHRLLTQATIGYTTYVSRNEEAGGMIWRFGQKPPIDLAIISGELQKEFALAIAVYEDFKALVCSTYLGNTFVIEKCARNYSAYVPDLPGCVSTGTTLEEVKAEIREAIEFHLDGMREDGAPIPPPSSRAEYVEVGEAEARAARSLPRNRRG